VKEPGEPETWIDSFLFADDPLVTPRVRSEQHGRGGSGIVRLDRSPDGVWRGRRDIILPP